MSIALKSKVKDRVTGFVGIAVSRTEYMNGCIRYGVQASVQKKDNDKLPETYYFDEDQLDVIGDRLVKKPEKKKPTGGDRKAPSAPHIPRNF